MKTGQYIEIYLYFIPAKNSLTIGEKLHLSKRRDNLNLHTSLGVLTIYVYTNSNYTITRINKIPKEIIVIYIDRTLCT